MEKYTETYKGIEYLVNWIDNECTYLFNNKEYKTPLGLRKAINKHLSK
jgi:hypothetical protein